MNTIKKLADMTGNVSLITGGAGYIGSAICESLAELGSDIVIIDNNENNGLKKKETIESEYGVSVLYINTDLSNVEDIQKIPKIVLKVFSSIDVLINCAALGGTSPLKGWTTSFETQSVESWNKALDINLTAAFALTQACSNNLRESNTGSVINIGSIYGLVGPDMRIYKGTTMGNPAAYAASKGGIIQLTRYLATVLAPDVRVNSITPGGVWRNQPESFVHQYERRTPLQRMATEEDFKGAALYLASNLSAYVTGHNLVVDGGWTVW